MKQRGRSGQSTAEYAILIAIVVAGMVGMQVYVKRGLQARYKVASDRLTAGTATEQIGDRPFLHTVDQYEPYYANQDVGTQQDRTESDQFTGDGTITRTIAQGQDVTKRGSYGGGTGTREQSTRQERGDDTAWQHPQE